MIIRSLIVSVIFITGIIGLGVTPELLAQRIITVTSTGDQSDENISGTVCSVNPGGLCTFRAALQESNFTGAVDTIRFNIAGTDANCTAGVCTISPGSQLPDITKKVIIEGDSQPGATCGSRTVTQSTDSGFGSRDLRIEIDGTSAGTSVGLVVVASGDSTVVRGLVINRFNLFGIALNSAGDVWIACNYIGTDITGMSAAGNGLDGILSQFDNQNNIIGTNGDGVNDDREGNVISGNGRRGIYTRNGNTGTRVSGNYVGFNKAATDTIPNVGVGVENNGSSIVIGTDGDGTSDLLEANVIVGNSFGIQLSGGATGSTIAGNRIGTDFSGILELGNIDDAVWISSASRENIVGYDGVGSDAAERNVIAYNGGDGVDVRSGEIPILSNHIYANGGLGIDLLGDGPTSNDSADVDTGTNILQNFPDLIAAGLGSLTLIYSVDSDTTHSDFPLRIEFFKADADGQEGQEFLGFDMYTVSEWSDCGTAPCADTVTFAAAGLATSDSLVATATESGGNTSEFSPAIGLSFNGISLYVKAFLEGPYSAANDMMNTDLFDVGVLPLSQPFSDATFDGTVLDFDSVQTAGSHPDSTVDWLLVSLRSGTAPGTEVAGTRHAAVIFEGGTIVSPDDDSLRFAGIDDGSYYLVVRSRDHLDIMSSTAIVVSGGVGSWDFTTALTQAFGVNAHKELETGVWGMFAGDGSIDGQVTVTDFNDWLVDTKAVATGYLQTDFDLDAQVTASDFNLWLVNTKAVATSKVP